LERIKELLKSEEPLRWLFTGDSITEGILFTYGERDYVQIFEERLRFEMGRTRDFVIRTAVGGWTAQNVLDDIEWNILQFNPHVVSIMLGMNDAGEGPEYADTFANNYRAILDTIDKRCGAKVIMHTPNTVIPGGRPYVERGLLPMVEKIREIAGERGLPLIDHWAYWEKAWQENDRRIYSWMGNAVHPNTHGQRALARLLLQELGMWDEEALSCRLFVP